MSKTTERIDRNIKKIEAWYNKENISDRRRTALETLMTKCIDMKRVETKQW